MASTKGFSQWVKYYKGKGDVEIAVKKAGKLKPTSNKTTTETNIQQGEIITLLEIKSDDEYYSYSSSKNRTPTTTAWLPVKYKNKKYLCSIDIMSKPKETGGLLDFKLQTANLIQRAKKKKYDLMGEKNVECAVYTSATEMKTHCLSYIKSNKLLDSAMNLKQSLMRYFSSSDASKIEFLESVTDSEIAQFKYIGEVAIAMILLEKTKVSSAISSTNTVPFTSNVKEVIFPLDESFAGADSFVKTKDGTIYAISSKAGKGAAASFWTNLYPKIMKNKKYRDKSKILKDIYDSAQAIGVTTEQKIKTSGKQIVYEYGVRKILNMSAKEYANSYDLYEDFKKYDDISDYSVESRNAFFKLKEMMKEASNETALKNLDESTTVFFCKTLADRMNDDENTINVLLEILSEKDYYQANQDMKELKNGNVKFRITRSGGGTLKMIGTKSAYRNIQASQGTINYEITKK